MIMFSQLSSEMVPQNRIIMDINNARKNFTKYLNQVAELAGIKIHLTSYTTRHSWASLANENDVNISVTSHGLGHADIKTTQIYLRNIVNDEIDLANEKITGSIKFEKREIPFKKQESKPRAKKRTFSKEALDNYINSNKESNSL